MLFDGADTQIQDRGDLAIAFSFGRHRPNTHKEFCFHLD